VLFGLLSTSLCSVVVRKQCLITHRGANITLLCSYPADNFFPSNHLLFGNLSLHEKATTHLPCLLQVLFGLLSTFLCSAVARKQCLNTHVGANITLLCSYPADNYFPKQSFTVWQSELA
jgi:hypothetical protein